MPPKIYRDKKGNRYIRDGKKKIKAPANISDTVFLKWLIRYLKPKRTKRRTPSKSKAPPPPMHVQEIFGLTPEQASNDTVRAVVNAERERLGKEKLDAPQGPGLPAMIDDEAKAQRQAEKERRRAAREAERKKLVEEKEAAITEHKRERERKDASFESIALQDAKKKFAIGKAKELRENLKRWKFFKDLSKEEKKHFTTANELTDLLMNNAAMVRSQDEHTENDWLDEIETLRQQRLEELQTRGHGKDDSGEGTSTSQIDERMDTYRPNYLGTIALNEWDLLTAPVPQSKSAWIMNTDPNTKPGQHWVAFLLDLNDMTMEYYNSFADPMSAEARKNLQRFLDMHLSNIRALKLKENKIIDQDASTSNCGQFCMRFIMDRFRGKPFREVTKFDDSVKGEEKIEEWKKQHGFGFNDYIMPTQYRK